MSNNPTVIINHQNSYALILDEMINFLISLKTDHGVSGDTEICTEYDCELITFNSAEITPTHILLK